jgi:hypothetical protein
MNAKDKMVRTVLDIASEEGYDECCGFAARTWCQVIAGHDDSWYVGEDFPSCLMY